MAVILVGIGEYKISRNGFNQIKTMALGSCVAVTFYYPSMPLGGMIHIALPDSSINRNKALMKPGYFADSGLKAFYTKFKKNIKDFEKKKLIVKIAGGASVMDSNSTFNIGKRNIAAIKKILAQYRLPIVAIDVGKMISRTVTLDLKNGSFLVSSPKKGK